MSPTISFWILLGVFSLMVGHTLMHSTAGDPIISKPALSASSKIIGGTGRRQGLNKLNPAFLANSISCLTSSALSGYDWCLL